MLNKAGFEWEPDKIKKDKRSRGMKGRLQRSRGMELSDDEDWEDEDEDWGDDYDGLDDDDPERMEEEEEIVALIIRHADEIGRKNEEKHKEWEREEEERRKRDDERHQIEAEWTAIQGEWQEIETERRKLECDGIALERKMRKAKEKKRALEEGEARIQDLLEKSELLHKRLDAEQTELDHLRKRLAEAQIEEQQRMQRERHLWDIQKARLEDEVRELRARLASAPSAVNPLREEAATATTASDVRPSHAIKQESTPPIDNDPRAAVQSDEKSNGQLRNRKRKRNDSLSLSPRESSEGKSSEMPSQSHDAPTNGGSSDSGAATRAVGSVAESSRPHRVKRAASHGVAELIKRQKKEPSLASSSVSKQAKKEKQKNDSRGEDGQRKERPPVTEPAARSPESSTPIPASRKKKKMKKRSKGGATSKAGVKQSDAMGSSSERMVQSLNHC